MPYKPKFCCQCGEKIDTTDWKFWTSRRFCDLCATEFGIYDKAIWAFVGIGLIFGLYGIGSYFQKPGKPLPIASVPLIVPNKPPEAPPPRTVAQVPASSDVQTVSKTSLSPDLKTKPKTAPAAEITERVYFCGAPTRKGTMCSRRVKNGGRCWQHEGQEAMLAQEKLLIVQ